MFQVDSSHLAPAPVSDRSLGLPEWSAGLHVRRLRSSPLAQDLGESCFRGVGGYHPPALREVA